jgi:hypothetical protein
LLLRALCQPLATLSNAIAWRVGLIASGVLEGAALLGIVSLIALTLKNGPKLALRPAFRGVFPLIAGAFAALALAGLVNLLNVFLAQANAGMVVSADDDLNGPIRPADEMDNVKPMLGMKKRYEETKDATHGRSGTVWGRREKIQYSS